MKLTNNIIFTNTKRNFFNELYELSSDKKTEINSNLYRRNMLNDEKFIAIANYKSFRGKENISEREYHINSNYFENKHANVWLSLFDGKVYIFNINLLKSISK